MRLALVILVALVLAVTVFVGIMCPSFAALFGGIGNLISLVLAILAYCYVVLTNSMVQEMSKAREEETRAYIVADMQVENFDSDKYAVLVIRNDGRSPAFHVNIAFDPELVFEKDKEPEQKFLDKPVMFFAPGASIRAVLGRIEYLQGIDKPQRYTVNITYPLGSRKVSESYELSLTVPKHGSYRGPGTMYNLIRQVERLADEITSMRKHMEEQESNDKVRRLAVQSGTRTDAVRPPLRKQSQPTGVQGVNTARSSVAGRVKKAIEVLLAHDGK